MKRRDFLKNMVATAGAAAIPASIGNAAVKEAPVHIGMDFGKADDTSVAVMKNNDGIWTFGESTIELNTGDIITIGNDKQQYKITSEYRGK